MLEININKPRKRHREFIAAYIAAYADDTNQILDPTEKELEIETISYGAGMAPVETSRIFRLNACDVSTPGPGRNNIRIGANIFPKQEFIPPINGLARIEVYENIVNQELQAREAIMRIIGAETFEVGEEHPAEREIARLLNDRTINDPEHFFDNIYLILFTQTESLYRLIRVLGRLDRRLIFPWIHKFLQKCLGHYDIEVRSAAAYTLDRLGDRSSISLLSQHHDAVPWLQEYIEEVLADHS